MTALLLVGLVAPVQAALLYDFDDTGAISSDNRTWTAGGRFFANSPVTVAALGFIDTDGSLAIDHEVGLWSDAGVLLASVDVPAGTSAPLVEGFRWVNLTTPIVLAAGTYRIGAEVVEDSGDRWYNATQGTITQNPDLIILANGVNQPVTSALGATGLTFPNFTYSGQNTLFVAANLSTVAIPEPSSVVLMGLGLLGMIGFGRRRK
ncbi:MAG: DUF4082 domain-containing protein [Planctomycetes bacterium]|nr:DUF4082 domain-containing protein [Planctomycetota bacterium]